MSGVRFVASVFAWLGWIAVIIGGVATVGTIRTVGEILDQNSDLVAVASGLVPLVTTLLASLVPFFLWALLTVLLEIHAQGERNAEALDHTEPVNPSETPASGD